MRTLYQRPKYYAYAEANLKHSEWNYILSHYHNIIWYFYPKFLWLIDKADSETAKSLNLLWRSTLLHKDSTKFFKNKDLFSAVQLLSHVQLFVTPWTAAHQASRSINNSQSLLKFMSIESGMTANHLILCHPLLLQPSILPSIRVFSNESVLCIKWPKY